MDNEDDVSLEGEEDHSGDEREFIALIEPWWK